MGVVALELQHLAMQWVLGSELELRDVSAFLFVSGKITVSTYQSWAHLAGNWLLLAQKVFVVPDFLTGWRGRRLGQDHDGQ